LEKKQCPESLRGIVFFHFVPTSSALPSWGAYHNVYGMSSVDARIFKENWRRIVVSTSIGFYSGQNEMDDFEQAESGQPLVAFDSGTCITFQDECMHTIVSGTTGIGKSQQRYPAYLEEFVRSRFSRPRPGCQRQYD
jgi:hypothetical protein